MTIPSKANEIQLVLFITTIQGKFYIIDDIYINIVYRNST